MKFDRAELELDPIDLSILMLLQENCKKPLAAIGEKVGLTASSVMERIHKLESAGVIRGYSALLDARAIGKDVSAFIGVSVSHPREVGPLQQHIEREADVLECHHVTGEHTLMLKVKTENTESLEQLIDTVRGLEGVNRTETMVVLSTHVERVNLAFDVDDAPAPPTRRGRRRRKDASDASQGAEGER